MVEMASRLRLPVLWPFGRMAAWRRQVQVHWMRQPYVSDSRHHLRPDPHSTHGLVFSLLVFREWQRWDLGAELEADLGDRLLPDGVGYPSSLAVWADSPRSGAPLREGGGGRNLHRRQGIWTFGRPCQREEDPDVYRDRDPGAEGIETYSRVFSFSSIWKPFAFPGSESFRPETGWLYFFSQEPCGIGTDTQTGVKK